MMSILQNTVASSRFASTPAALFIAAFLFVGGTAHAQSTVVIGGSGKSNVEVNLDVLNPASRSVNSALGRRVLRMPGESMAGSGGPIKLRVPAGMKRAAASSATAPTIRPRPKFKLKPPAMPTAKVPRVVATPAKQIAAKPAPTAPRKITKPAPLPPKPVVKAVTPPPPPPAPTLPAVPSSVPSSVTKIVAAKPLPKPVAAPAVEVVPAVPVAPVKQVAPKPVAKPAKQIASLPRAKLPGDGGLVSQISFTGSSTRLSNDAKQQLQALAAQIANRDDRLQLKAYAGGTSDSSSSARRLSLSRALAVRSFLIETGVRSTRIDVRALGRAADAGPPDRVDMILLVR